VRISVGPFGLGIAPDVLEPGRADREGGVVFGGDRLQRDQVDAAAGGEAVDVGNPDRITGVAAAGDQQQVGLRSPTVRVAGADYFGDVLERVEARVGAPVGDAARVVVAVVGRRPLIDLSVRADADLDPLPVVDVKLAVVSRQCSRGSDTPASAVWVIVPRR
jgi:hypothetical protein